MFISPMIYRGFMHTRNGDSWISNHHQHQFLCFKQIWNIDILLGKVKVNMDPQQSYNPCSHWNPVRLIPKKTSRMWTSLLSIFNSPNWFFTNTFLGQPPETSQKSTAFPGFPRFPRHSKQTFGEALDLIDFYPPAASSSSAKNWCPVCC